MCFVILIKKKLNIDDKSYLNQSFYLIRVDLMLS